MRILSLILIGTLMVMLTMPSTALAISLSISARVTGGTSLTHTLLKCYGYKFSADPNADPWSTANCPTQTPSGTTLDFGTLTHYFLKPDGTEDTTQNAGCFYAKDFFIVYLYPDAWGGKGYQLSQASATLPGVIENAVVFTPVYSERDKMCWGSPPTCKAQGPLDSTEETNNPQLTPSVPQLARVGGLILKAYRGRIVRAEYSIPPKRSDGTPWVPGWQAIPLTTAPNTYSATLSITLTPI